MISCFCISHVEITNDAYLMLKPPIIAHRRRSSIGLAAREKEEGGGDVVMNNILLLLFFEFRRTDERAAEGDWLTNCPGQVGEGEVYLLYLFGP